VANQFSRRGFLKTAALTSAGMMLHQRMRAQPTRLPRRPNLIVFLPDQQRADTISCYGAPANYTPNLNQLASQSCVLQRAYAAQPICTPSRSCLLTGTWPHSNGCTRNGLTLDSGLACLPELLADPEYRFGYLGKWHLGHELVAQHGFGDWVSILSGQPSNLVDAPHYSEPTSDYEKFLQENGIQLKPDETDASAKRAESKLPLQFSKARFLEMKACEFLEQHRREQFVLFVAFYEPHPPYNGPLNDLYPVAAISNDATAHQVFGVDVPLRYRLRQEWARRRFGAKDKFRKTKAKYLGLVTQMDRSIGAILTRLEQLGLAEDTIVMHTSDHGDMMSAHGLIGKQVMFEESLRIPWLVRLPAQNRSFSVAQPVSHIDFAPTVLDLLGKPAPKQCAGTSIAPLLRGESMPATNVFAEWHPGRTNKVVRKTALAKSDQIARAFGESTRSIVTPEGWKLNLRDTDRNELYHLATDPAETHNLYPQLAGNETVRKLTGEIHRWQESVTDSIKV
jgi:arylsulfatase A-like enzyme